MRTPTGILSEEDKPNNHSSDENQTTTLRANLFTNMSDVIAEQTTTMPEGATVSVVLCQGKAKAFTELRARRGDDMIAMRLSNNVSPHALPTLLVLSIKQIEKEQALQNAIGYVRLGGFRRPSSFTEFVSTMVDRGMFLTPILDINTPEPMPEPIKPRKKTVKKAGKSKAKKVGKA